jgi:predicted metalloprotease
MRWQGERESGNVEDRRGMSGGGKIAIGGVGGIIILVISLLLGKNPLDYINTSDVQDQPATEQVSASPEEEKEMQFVGVVLAETEDVWAEIFEGNGKTYIAPKLDVFRQSIQSGCGFASAASGPFYCPRDSKVYIDLSFYDELRDRFGVNGDFAMAYVISHEVGHHVQHLLGITDKVDAQRSSLSETDMNRLSVKLELQADFLAGVWANHMKTRTTRSGEAILEEGDIEEALNAANAIGDDRLQKESQCYVVPDAFTHGTSKQRMYWFKKGFDTGDIRQGDTFEEMD